MEWQSCPSCPTTAASRMQRSAWDKARRQEMGLRFSKSSGSGGTLRQLLDSTFGQICLFVSSHEKSPQTFVSAACQCPWLADNIPSPPCCCLLSRESSPHPIPAAGPPSMETPPSVTQRRPTGGMPVKPCPVCLLESSVSPCQQSLGFASCPSASPVRSSRELTQLR